MMSWILRIILVLAFRLVCIASHITFMQLAEILSLPHWKSEFNNTNQRQSERTSRAFMNVQLVRAGLPPLYIKVEEKTDYIKALERADKTGDYDELYEVIFKTLLKCHVDLRDRF